MSVRPYSVCPMIDPSSWRCRECSFVHASTVRPQLFVGLLVAATGFAQSIPPLSPPPAVGEETIVLTPFTVDSTKDRGYQAENTLSGSRLNSSLADTPASVSVFTREFVQDVGLTELNELIE